MKKIILMLIAGSLIWVAGANGTANAEKLKEELSGSVTLSGAWALYPMAVKWADEFHKLYPKVRIEVAAGGAGKGMADCLARIVDIGMVSRDIYPEEVKKGAWWVSVTKDAVVPTVNADNPVLKELLEKGVSRELITEIWLNENAGSWEKLVGREGGSVINVYTRSDACGAAKTWAGFFGKEQEDLLGVGVYGDPGLAEAIKRDVLGIGYNNINYVYDLDTQFPVEGLVVLPIDLDGNGRVDENENFYISRNAMIQAIVDGRYPSPPARNLHFVCQGKPESKEVIAFLTWVLTEGQKYVKESGYIPLSDEKLRGECKKIQVQ